MQLQLNVHYRPQLEERNLWQKVILFNTSIEEKKISSLLVTVKSMGDCHNSSNKKPLHFKLSASSKRLFVYNSIFWMHKRAVFLLCSLDLQCLAIRPHVPNCKLLFFTKKLVVLEKYLLAICLKSVNNIKEKNTIHEIECILLGYF